jgi:hypothetical protein
MGGRQAAQVPRHWERGAAVAAVAAALVLIVASGAGASTSATPVRSSGPATGVGTNLALKGSATATSTSTVTTTTPVTATVPGTPASATTVPPYGWGPDGAISGVVTDTSLNPLGGVLVSVYVPGAYPAEAGFATSSTDGTYQVTSLRPGVYWVCFGVQGVVGTSTTGYQVQCYNNGPYIGFGRDVMPYGVVTVTEGSTTSEVDDTLQRGAEISGTVTDLAGRPIADVYVQVTSTIRPSWEQMSAMTAANGTYSTINLNPSSYYICFSGYQVTGPGAPAGYLGQCYNSTKNVPFELNKVVKGETAVSTTVGATVDDISAELPPAAGISGRVTNSKLVPLQDVRIYVYYPGARPALAGESITTVNGTFSLPGLPAGRYRLCFAATSSTQPQSSVGYVNRCYGARGPWDGYPTAPVKGAKAVMATPGSFTGDINEKLF